MKPVTGTCVALAAWLLLAGCASTRIPRDAVTGSDADALALLTASQRAQGATSFSTVRDLKARLASRWSSLGSRFQPALADQRYRRESEAAMDLTNGTIVQLDKGGGGRKFVMRAPGRTTVWYNGQPDSREEVIRAAAVVADLEKLYLLGPHYFQRSGVSLEKLGPTKVDGAACDQVLAVLQPGFGFADEDRVILSLDRDTQILRRVAVTLSSLKDGSKQEVEATFHHWQDRGGIKWAEDFDERLRGRFSIPLRRGKFLEVQVNHGFAPREPEMLGEALGAAASRLQ